MSGLGLRRIETCQTLGAVMSLRKLPERLLKTSRSFLGHHVLLGPTLRPSVPASNFRQSTNRTLLPK